MPLLFSLNPFAVVAQAMFLFVNPNPRSVWCERECLTERGSLNPIPMFAFLHLMMVRAKW